MSFEAQKVLRSVVLLMATDAEGGTLDEKAGRFVDRFVDCGLGGVGVDCGGDDCTIACTVVCTGE